MTCGPGGRRGSLAHFSTAIEGLVPLVLFFSHGGWPTAIAAFVMLCFHFGILSSIPMGVPLEWNVFMMFCVLALFVGHCRDRAGRSAAARGRSCCSSWSPAPWCWETCSRARSRSCRACATTRVTGTPRCGASSPRRSEKIEKDIVAIASMPAAQMEKFYGSQETAQMYLYMGYAFRAFNTHGRAMFTLAHRAMAGHNEDDYVLTDGERIWSRRPSAGTSVTAT